MKLIYKKTLSWVLGLSLLGGAVTFLYFDYIKTKQTNRELTENYKALQEQEAKSKEYQTSVNESKEFALLQMRTVNPKISPLRRDVLSKIIAEVVTSTFSRKDHREAFIAILAIESGFNQYAQSPTGPKGLSQVAKAAFKEGIEKCSKLKFEDDDVWNEYVNVMAGACYYKMILEGPAKGNPNSASVAYNQGLNSADFKSYMKSGYIQGEEARNYLVRFVHKTTLDKNTKPLAMNEEASSEAEKAQKLSGSKDKEHKSFAVNDEKVKSSLVASSKLNSDKKEKIEKNTAH